ncbi:hypothetical protein [Bacillus sp. FJAT-45350]|uniref:hypothetical protein n=1 Tax=Bacillus sp. FJAT-45350 TaxID=2011014 RepID=UPI0015C92E64|nr:hypothetical protein [Bacillus sp. FJAT-45350]
MCQMEKYQHAWSLYLTSCEKHGITCNIDYSSFVNSLTVEQVEQMFEHSLQQIN